MVTKSWHLLPHDPGAVERLAQALRLSPIVAQLLYNRGLALPEQAQQFLDVPFNGLHPPDLLPGVPEAADRVYAAVKAGRSICIYGDYDVDGVTGTAILLQVLRLMGATVEIYLPHRLEEGYGLNVEALRQIKQGGASTVVTVDCGIASLEEALEARRLGLELIVTDHHEMRETLPEAAVLVHPRLPGTSYPFTRLSGSAVAFKLAWSLAQRACGSERVPPHYREFLLDGVALASLGVIADVVPLHEENRIFVKHGLSRLRKQAPLGLKALCEVAGVADLTTLRASDIGFRLAPRLNAAGRLGCARLVVDLLTATQAQRAHDLAHYLEAENEKRQTIEREMVRSARQVVENSPEGSLPALVLASPDWHAGVIGIVASRLVDLFGRPVLMIALRDNGEGLIGYGSGRSIPGFALNEALQACSKYLLSHGGHKAAAGFRVPAEHVDAFRVEFCAYAERHFPQGPPAPVLTLDAEVPLSALTVRLVADLDRLEPYGAENPRPLFLAGDLQVEGEPRKVGKGERHLSFRVRQQATVLKAIGWNMAERLEELMTDAGRCSLAFTPKINEWRGMRTVDLEVTDFQTGPRTQLT